MSQEIRFRFAVDGAPEAAGAFRQVGQAAAQVGSTATTQGLATAAKGVDTLGVSARQTAAAMRVLPAQLTDITTQLAGGQNPFLVLLQQGGQIKDSFGGIGNAARALASTVTPMRLALLGAGGALGVLAAAASAGDKEGKALARTLEITGNAAGLTADRFKAMASAVQAATGSSIGSAKDTLLELAGSGRLSGKALEQAAIAAERLSLATGESADVVGKRLVGGLDDIARAAATLNKQYGFLTIEQFKHIKALQEQGKLQEAAAETFKLLNDRVGDQTKNLGFLEQRWRALQQVVGDVWDAMKAIGRDDTVREALEKTAREINVILQASNFREPAQGTFSATRIKLLREQLAALKELEAQQDKTASENAKRQASTNKAIADILAGTKNTGAAYRALISDIREVVEAEQVKRDGYDSLTEAQRLQIKLYGQLGEVFDKLTPKERARVSTLIEEAAALKAINNELARSSALLAARGREILGMQQVRDEGESEIADMLRRDQAANAAAIKAVDDRIAALTDEERAVALSRSANIALAVAIEQVSIARLQERRISLVNDPAGLKAIDDEIAKREALALLIGSSEARKANERSAEENARAWERAFDQISQSLTDALMDGGRSGAEYVKGLFRAMVLRPVVQYGVNSLLGAAGQQLGGGFGLGQAAGLGNLLGYRGTSIAAGWEGLATSGIGQSLGLSSLAEDAAGNIFLQQSAGSSAFGSALSSVAPYLAAAAAIYSIAKSLDSSGTPHFGGYAALDAMGRLVPGYGAGESNRSADYDALVGNLIRPVGTALNSLVAQLGLGGGFGVAGTFKAQADGKDGAWGIVQIDRAGGNSVFRRADGTLAGDPTKGFEEYTKLLGTSVREALDQLDLPGWADELLGKLDQTAATEQIIGTVDQITQTAAALDTMAGALATMGGLFERIAGSSSDTQYALAQLFGGVDVLAAQAGAYYDAFFTASEKAARGTRIVAEALGEVGLVAPDTRDAYRALVEAQDATTEGGRENIRALLGVAGVFADLHPLADQVAADLSRQAEVLRERQSLEVELLRLQGDTAELRARELAALDESNRALQLQVWGLQDAAEAARELAAQQAEAARLAAQAIDQISAAAQRLAAAQGGVTTALQALADYRRGLADQLAGVVADIAGVRSRALADVDSARDRLAGVMSSIASAVEAAAQRVSEAEQAIASARGQRSAAATSIAQLLGQQRGDVLTALLGLGGAAGEASAGEVAARNRITDAYLSAQAEATRAQERLAGLQGRAADRTEDLARVMGRLSESIGDYLLDLTVQGARISQRPDVARAQFLDVAARAQAGDATAAAQLVGLARSFRDTSLAGRSTAAQARADDILIRQVLARVGSAAAAAAGVPVPGGDTSAAIAAAQQDLATALAEVQRLRGIAETAGASLTANAVDLLAEWRQAQQAATEAQRVYTDATSAASALGVVQADNVSAFDAALLALGGSLERVSTAGVDLALADTRDALQGLLDGYAEADAAVASAAQAYSDRLVDQARVVDLFASAQSMAVAAGVRLGDTLDGVDALFGELGAAARSYAEAQSVAAAIDAGQGEAAQSLLEEYRALTGQATSLTASLAEFDRRVSDIDFSGLQVLDPLGDLLQTYAGAVNELIGATDAQQQLQRTGQWTDIGGGFSRYVSRGGAVAVQRIGQEPQVAGIDGRVFGLGAIQDYVRMLFGAGDLATIYKEAVAFGISSEDLERITGTGQAVLAWAQVQGLPAFAGGTPYVPSTGLALVHEGERILPAPDNAMLMQLLREPREDVAAEVRALREEVAQLRAENMAGQVGIAEGTRETARTLKRWDGDGVPVRNADGTTLDTTP